MTKLVWFRNDLRVADNPALYEACEAANGQPVVGIFLISPDQWRDHGVGAIRQSFVKETLEVLHADLQALGIALECHLAPSYTDAPQVLLRAASRHQAKAIYFNAEYPLDEQRRDQAVQNGCAAAGVRCSVHHGDVILTPGQVLKTDRTPYAVYSAFKRCWQSRVTRGDLTPLPVPDRPAAGVNAGERQSPDDRWQALTALPTLPKHPDWPAGEAAALERLERFVDHRIVSYAAQRDLPGKEGTSRLSAYLSVGAISARTCYHHGLNARASGAVGVDAWLNELIWREFYRHVIALFPHVSRGRSFRREMDRLPWRHDPEALAAWQAGETGYPLVDAGMRQLNQTGFMHNRLRMVTAMFLTKHLLIDWREGERYFMQQLRDGDFPSNNGGWQWSASTGTDAAPYFRIFNPASQAKKFDPDGEFVRSFVTELATDSPTGYPPPIVEHRAARERALRFFRRDEPAQKP